MDEDEEKARKIARYVIGQDVGDLSIDEIGETISALQDEIARLTESKAEKSAHLSAAASLFKS